MEKQYSFLLTTVAIYMLYTFLTLYIDVVSHDFSCSYPELKTLSHDIIPTVGSVRDFSFFPGLHQIGELLNLCRYVIIGDL